MSGVEAKATMILDEASEAARDDVEGAGHTELLATYLAKRENLLRFLATRCGSKSQAEDLAQELYFKVAAVRPTVVVENPTALIYRMAANIAIDHLRQRRRYVAGDNAWGEAQRTNGAEPASTRSAVEEALVAREHLAALLRMVEGFPARRQQIFRLHKLEGRSRAETAHLLGISVKAVEKQITAALKALTWTKG